MPLSRVKLTAVGACPGLPPRPAAPRLQSLPAGTATSTMAWAAPPLIVGRARGCATSSTSQGHTSSTGRLGDLATWLRAKYAAPPFMPVKLDGSSLFGRAHAGVTASLPHFTFFLHAGFMFSIAATYTNDLLVVRSLLTARAFSLIAYHSMFPQPVLVRVGWTLLIAVMDARMLYLVARDRDALRLDVALSAEDETIFKRSFEPFGFTRVMFDTIRRHAHLKTYHAGEMIVEEGSEMTGIRLKLSGNVNLLKDGKPVVIHEHFDTHVWLGELWDAKWDPNIPHYNARGLLATSDVQTLEWDKRWLHNHFMLDPTNVRKLCVHCAPPAQARRPRQESRVCPLCARMSSLRS